MDVHVLPGFLPDKKKKKGGVGVGLVSLMQLTSLASSTQTCQPSMMMIIKPWSLQTTETAATETGSA